MYEQRDKRRLYWLINRYIKKEIDEINFCDEFYYCYNLSIEKEKLDELENKVFRELERSVSRFSSYEEDHQLDALAFTSKEELTQKILNAKKLLQDKD